MYFPFFIKDTFLLTCAMSSGTRIMEKCVEVEVRIVEVGYRRLTWENESDSV